MPKSKAKQTKSTVVKPYQPIDFFSTVRLPETDETTEKLVEYIEQNCQPWLATFRSNAVPLVFVTEGEGMVKQSSHARVTANLKTIYAEWSFDKWKSSLEKHFKSSVIVIEAGTQNQVDDSNFFIIPVGEFSIRDCKINPIDYDSTPPELLAWDQNPHYADFLKIATGQYDLLISAGKTPTVGKAAWIKNRIGQYMKLLNTFEEGDAMPLDASKMDKVFPLVSAKIPRGRSLLLCAHKCLVVKFERNQWERLIKRLKTPAANATSTETNQ